MAKFQAATIENLEIIKEYIDLKDASSLKSLTIDGNVLKFYKVESPTSETIADYTITLPETDVSGLIAKMTGTTEGNVVVANTDGTVKDGGVALTDLATKTDVEEVDGKIGTLGNLETTSKTDVVTAINEVRNAISAGGTEAAVTITTDTTTEGYLKSYTIKQGENTVGIIDIPKDLVVTSGEIVVNPDADHTGTYVKLTIANQETPVYINVKDLVDAYTAQASATQVQLVISDTNEISATIVAGSVGTTELSSEVNTTLTQVATNKTDIEELQTLVGEGVEAIPEADIRALFS